MCFCVDFGTNLAPKMCLSWEPFWKKKKYFRRFFGYANWIPILYRFWNQNLMVSSSIVCCFFGVSFTCVAFRVIFANVRFTSVKHRLVRSSDDIFFSFFVHVLLGYVCMHVPMDLGSILGRILARIWDDFTRNVGILWIEKTNKKNHEKIMEKCSQKAPNLAPEEWKAKALFAIFSCLGHPWEPTWCQDLPQEALGAVLGRFWDRFGHILGAFWKHFRQRFGRVCMYLGIVCLNFV